MSLVLAAPPWRRIRSRTSAPAGARAPPASTTSWSNRSGPLTCLYRPYTRPNTAEVRTEGVRGGRPPRVHRVGCSTKGAPSQGFYWGYTKSGGLHWGCTKSGVPLRMHQVRGFTKGAAESGVLPEGAPSQGFSLRVHQVRSSTEGAPSQGFHQECTESGVLLRLHQVRGSHWGCTKSGVPLRVHQVRASTWGFTKSGVLLRLRRVRGSIEGVLSQGFHWERDH